MSIHMICDGCGAEMAHSQLHADIDLRGAVQLKDQSHHDWCGICWTTALRAVIERRQELEGEMSAFAGQRWQDIPVDEPPPFTYPTIKCPECRHGIDPHGTDPGGPCGVGDERGKLCPCMWQPNDIAAASGAGDIVRLQDMRLQDVPADLISDSDVIRLRNVQHVLKVQRGIPVPEDEIEVARICEQEQANLEADVAENGWFVTAEDQDS